MYSFKQTRHRSGWVVYPKIAPKETAPLSGRRVIGSHRPWTPKEDQIVRDHYPRLETAEVAAMINRTKEAVIRHAADLGVYKTLENMKRIRGRAKFRVVA